MNALAATGTNQVSLLAAFTLPVANAAPEVPATPAFVNLISLMLSSPDQAASLISPDAARTFAAKPSASFQATAASPAKIADAMIRSMLFAGNAAPSPPVTAKPAASNGLTAPVASSNAPVTITPAPAAASAVNPAPTPEAILNQAVNVPTAAIATPATAMPTTAMPATAMPAPLPTPIAIPVSTDAAQNDAPAPANDANPPATPTGSPNQTTQAPRKQLRNIADVPMTTAIAITPAPTAIVTTPAATSSASAPNTTTPTPASGQGSPASVTTTPPPIKNSPQAQVAFTAVLTPLKETQAIGIGEPSGPEPVASQIAAPQESSASSYSYIPTLLAPASTPWPAPATPNIAPQTPVQPATTQAGGDTQQSAGSFQQQTSEQPTSQQPPSLLGNDSPETPTRPIAASTDAKMKPAVQQDDSALPIAAPANAVHAVPSLPAASPAGATHASEAVQSDATTTTATPYNSTAEALRTTESNLAAEPQVRSGAAQEIAIRIAPPDSPAVDLRVVERSGQVHVDVRTPDAAMQTSLRQDLGTLTNSLERAGYHTETFTPSSTLGRAASSGQTDTQQDPSQNRGGAGDFSGGRRQQQQQKRPGAWLEEFEEQP